MVEHKETELNKLNTEISKIDSLIYKLENASNGVEEAEDAATDALDNVLDAYPKSDWGADDIPGALTVRCVGVGSTYASVIEDVINALNDRAKELKEELCALEEATEVTND